MTIQDRAQLELALPIPSHHKPSASPGYIPDDDDKKHRDYKSEMAAIDEPILVKHEPFLGEEHARQMRQYKWIPYPYRLAKWDPAWIFVAFLFAGGFAFKLLWLLAGLIAFLRVVIWCSFRFPLTTFFFTSVIRNLMRGRRRRW